MQIRVCLIFLLSLIASLHVHAEKLEVHGTIIQREDDLYLQHGLKFRRLEFAAPNSPHNLEAFVRDYLIGSEVTIQAEVSSDVISFPFSSMYILADTNSTSVKVHPRSIVISVKSNQIESTSSYPTATLRLPDGNRHLIAFDGPTVDQGWLLSFLRKAHRQNATRHTFWGQYSDFGTLDIYHLVPIFGEPRTKEEAQIALSKSDVLATGVLTKKAELLANGKKSTPYALKLKDGSEMSLRPATRIDSKFLARFERQLVTVIAKREGGVATFTAPNIRAVGEVICPNLFLVGEK